jgi:predicted AlkP superfamily phosphohydrolase/phosphomutase
MTHVSDPQTTDQPAGSWRKALIIGLDGFSLHLVEDLLPAGTMPNLAAVLQRGAAGPLTSVFPTQSAPAWASFFTGQRPGRHGVLDFVERGADGRYHLARPTAQACLWNVLERRGLRTGLFGFPVTFPPSPINGFMAAGMLVPDGAVFTYPPELSARLRREVPGYGIDVKWQLYAGREMRLVQNLKVLTRQHLTGVQSLVRDFPVDCLAVAFLEPDRLHHALWRHLDPDHPEYDPRLAARWREPIGSYYQTLDAAIGQLIDGAEPGTGLVVVSDHGFQAGGRQFRVDEWLAGQGWLAFRQAAGKLAGVARRLDVPWVREVRRRLIADVSRHVGTLGPGGAIDWARTAAFCPWTMQQAVRLNLRGRDTHGIVEAGEEARRLLAEIRQALLETRDPATGRAVVAEVWDGAAYFGAEGPSIPDLVFATRPGYVTSPHQARLWQRTGWASGDHCLEGFWAVSVCPGPGGVSGMRRRGRVPAELVDVAPTLYYLLGLPIPPGVEGRPRVEVIEPDDRWPVWMEGGTAIPVRDGAGPPLDATEEKDVRSRLQGMGYLG